MTTRFMKPESWQQSIASSVMISPACLTSSANQYGKAVLVKKTANRTPSPTANLKPVKMPLSPLKSALKTQKVLLHLQKAPTSTANQYWKPVRITSTGNQYWKPVLKSRIGHVRKNK